MAVAAAAAMAAVALSFIYIELTPENWLQNRRGFATYFTLVSLA